MRYRPKMLRNEIGVRRMHVRAVFLFAIDVKSVIIFKWILMALIHSNEYAWVVGDIPVMRVKWKSETRMSYWWQRRRRRCRWRPNFSVATITTALTIVRVWCRCYSHLEVAFQRASNKWICAHFIIRRDRSLCTVNAVAIWCGKYTYFLPAPSPFHTPSCQSKYDFLRIANALDFRTTDKRESSAHFCYCCRRLPFLCVCMRCKRAAVCAHQCILLLFLRSFSLRVHSHRCRRLRENCCHEEHISGMLSFYVRCLSCYFSELTSRQGDCTSQSWTRRRWTVMPSIRSKSE